MTAGDVGDVGVGHREIHVLAGHEDDGFLFRGVTEGRHLLLGADREIDANETGLDVIIDVARAAFRVGHLHADLAFEVGGVKSRGCRQNRNGREKRGEKFHTDGKECGGSGTANGGIDTCQRTCGAVQCGMALFGSLQTVKEQVGSHPGFAVAFSYLEDVFAGNSAAGARLRSIAVGETQRVELAGGAFALEQAYRSKARAEGFFESHHRYIDVQVIVEGEEWMEVIDRAHAAAAEPYVDARDLVKYADCSGASRLRLRAGDVAIYYPNDVHMPGLAVDEGAGGLVRKTVVKVPVRA